TPSGIYDRPRTRFVAQFIGETNLLEGRVETVEGGRARIAIAGAGPVTVEAGEAPPAGASVLLSLRPEALNLAGEGENGLTATVTDIVYQGDHTRVHLDFEGRVLSARADRRSGPPPIG